MLKLTDSAKQFYNGCSELNLADVTWHKFKSVLGAGSETFKLTSTVL
jgi:hypothetical protein